MKLTKHQKDIVKNIACGNITDILSFVKHYNLGYEVCYDKEQVIKKFNDAYKDKKFVCRSKEFDEFDATDRIIERIDGKKAYCKPKISFQGAWYNSSCNGVNFGYPLFKPVYITKSVGEIISFIALWQYLKAQALIIELPKSCTKEDMALFLRQVKNNNYKKHMLNENEEYGYISLEVSYYDFLECDYELDSVDFEICLPYLQQKIYAAPELETYIQKRYKTNEELNNSRNLKIALAGVFIAIFTSIASIVMSTLDKGYYSELNQINNTLQKIQETMMPEDAATTEKK